jgi:hypothetical protein
MLVIFSLIFILALKRTFFSFFFEPGGRLFSLLICTSYLQEEEEAGSSFRAEATVSPIQTQAVKVIHS